MSQRGKRGNRLENENICQPPVKRRKGRPPIGQLFDIENDVGTTTIPVVSAGVQAKLGTTPSSSSTSTLWQARSISDLKISSIYNRSSSEAPAELFRKDLISAMKLPDSEPLSSDEYWIITDQWKQEWERGVQVPVNPDSLPEPSVKILQTPIVTPKHDFKLPKNKYVRITKDDTFSSDLYFLSNAPSIAESTCSYDLDQMDEVWLKLVNNERILYGATSISDSQFERVIEELEIRCWDKIQAIMKSEEGLGIEYDENVICDVCRSPDSEEANEMVFCDNCNICVHQACYGITAIPSGQWLCRTCSMGKKPECVLCPNKGGAMKSTRSGKKWAHVSCALWIPEVSIGCVDRMEPITKISSIPQSRWALLCILCRERVGACIQCSVKTCKTAYHVTCAFQHGLEMRAIIEEGNAEDGVKLRSYCIRHSVNKGKKDNKGTNNNSVGSGTDDEDFRRRRVRKDMTSEERNQARVVRLQEVESEFDKHVNIKDISCHLLDVDQDAISSIYNYWILKRKSGNNRPLIPPKTEDVDMLSSRQEQADIEKKKMFVHLRQDLERVRNLCYMVNRREKLSRSFFKMREQIFYKQISVLSENNIKNYDDNFLTAVIHANNGPSIYDKLYSSTNYAAETLNFADIQEKIKNLQKSVELDSRNCNKNKESKNSKNSFRKIHVNGISDVKNVSLFEDNISSSSSDIEVMSSDQDDVKSVEQKSQSYSKILEKHKIRKKLSSSYNCDSSSEDEAEIKNKCLVGKKNPSLHQMERELARDHGHTSSSVDSDDLISIKNCSNKQISKKPSAPIYSDSDSTDNTISDSQQQTVRTKAAMKEFTMNSVRMKEPQSRTHLTKTKRDINKIKDENMLESSQQDRLKLKERESVNNLRADKKKNHNLKTVENKTQLEGGSKRITADLLVVPQRQAAKKASENMRSTNIYTAQRKDSRDTKIEEKDAERSTTKDKDRLKDVKEEEREQEKDKVKSRGRPPKTPKEDLRDSEKEITKRSEAGKNDQSSPENLKNEKRDTKKIENNLLVAYVPQRQAAKKAAEHIKSGLGKQVAPENVSAPYEEKEKYKSDNDREKIEKTNEKFDKVSEFDVKKEKRKEIIEGRPIEIDNKIKLKEKDRNPKEDEKKLERSRRQIDKTNTPAIVLTSSSSDSSCCSSSCTSSSSDESDSDNESIDKPTVLTENDVKEDIRLCSPNSDPIKSESNNKENFNEIKSSNVNKYITIASPEKVNSSLLKEKVSNLSPKQEIQNAQKSKKSRKNFSQDTNFVYNSGQIQESLENIKKSPPSRKEDNKMYQQISSPQNSTFESSKDNKKNDSFENGLIRFCKENANIQTLEEEIAQRKADSQIYNTKNKGNKGVGSLDKLLDRKEKERKVKECPNSRNIRNKNVQKTIDSNNILSSHDIINCNAQESLSCDKNKCSDFNENNSEFKENQNSSKKELYGPELHTSPSDKSKFNRINEGKPSEINLEHRQRSCTLNLEINDNLHPLMENPQELFNVSSPQEFSQLKTGKENAIFSLQNKAFLKLEDSNILKQSIFDFEQNKEDSARETMNLVEKLRQKYKRSTSTNNKFDDTMNHLPKKDLDIKVDANFNSHSIEPILHKENDSFFNKKEDLSFEESKQNYSVNDDKNLKQNNSLTSIEQQLSSQHSRSPENHLPCDIVQEEAKEVILENKNKNELNSDIKLDNKNSICLKPKNIDHITTSNYFKGDFVDLRAKEILNSENPSLKLDSEYEENTRMQSPYRNVSNIWNENELIQTRRSVSSSPSSISECNEDYKQKQTTGQLVDNSRSRNLPYELDNINKQSINDLAGFDIHSQFHLQQQTSLQSTMNGIDILSSYNFPESGQYNGPVSLFPAQTVQNMNVPMPFPSPGAALFPPNLSGPIPITQTATQLNSSLFQQHNKLNQKISSNQQNIESNSFSTCGAAFTSSSHNLALTAAIVSTTVGHPSIASPQMIHNNYDLPNQNLLGCNNQNSNTSVNPILNSENILNDTCKQDSPSKRTSARFNQMKSPQINKSPGKSPRTMDMVHKSHVQKIKCDISRQKNRSSKGPSTNRIRGRGRGRGRLFAISQLPAPLDFEGHLSASIHNNLAGTVYDLDFDEDFSSCNVENLKSLRDRRRSFDCRSGGQTISDSKFTSPTSYHGKLRNSATLKSIGVLKSHDVALIESDVHNTHSLLHNIVHPVLPGPVDMRTYSSGFESQSVSSQEAYNNHLLGAFATGTADQTLHEIDEEVEKEFQSALKASGIKPKSISETISTDIHGPIDATSEEISIDSDTTNTKVSLSDSRNQLKLKIKGPLAHPDVYNTSNNCTTLTQNLASSNLGLQIPSASTCNLSSNTTGTSSLRRMRKKELLRQYWTQDMNMDDSNCLPLAESKISTDQVINRSVGIPKAVDSMSSIPTKEDYIDYTSTDPRKRKKGSGLSRELRQLDIPFDSECSERRRSIGSVSSNISGSSTGDNQNINSKRRGKNKTCDILDGSETPKLKIKIRNNVIETSNDSRRNTGCPPKKRLPNIPIPSLEILKRESMNYRKQIMADFGEEEKEDGPKQKIRKEGKISHKKKKKSKHHDDIRIIDHNNDTPKLIIRFGKRKAENDIQNDIEESPHQLSNTNNDSNNEEKPFIPIKLKLARNSHGDGYIIGGDNKSEDDKKPEILTDTNILENLKDCNEKFDECNEQDEHKIEQSSSAMTTAAVSVIPAHKLNNDLKGQSKASKGCPLLPLNKDCEVR